MTTLLADQKSAILGFLNDISADTFNEGEFGNWRFTSLSRDADRWRVGFHNTGAKDGDVLSFAVAGEALQADGAVSQTWIDALNAAIFEWEGEMRGEDYGNEDA